MKRLLLLLGLALIPGAAVAAVAAGIVAAWRYVFRSRQDELTAATVRRIRADAEQATRLREIEEVPRGRRTVLDGPPPPASFTRPWSPR